MSGIQIKQSFNQNGYLLRVLKDGMKDLLDHVLVRDLVTERAHRWFMIAVTQRAKSLMHSRVLNYSLVRSRRNLYALASLI
jgi:hypothetical protein